MSSNATLIDFSERLNTALDSKEVPPKGSGRQYAVAKMFNVSQKGARRWLEAEAFPDTKRLPAIADKLGVSVEWLMCGTGHPLREQTVEIGQEPTTKIPLLAWDKFHTWIENKQNNTIQNYLENILLSGVPAGKNSFAIRMKGSSMEPIFPEGTVLIIDPQKALINKNYVLVHLVRENSIVFRQLLLERENKYLKSLSPDFIGLAPVLLNEDDQIIGSLVQARLDF